jgi:hypothetical protein
MDTAEKTADTVEDQEKFVEDFIKKVVELTEDPHVQAPEE